MEGVPVPLKPAFLSMIQKSKPAIPRLIILLSFGIPMFILYLLDANSFSMTWKGRTFYLFFLWLVFLEIILSWEELELTGLKRVNLRSVAFAIGLALPTFYVITANNYGLNQVIIDISTQFQVPLSNWMPLAVEYLIFTGMFTLILLIGSGIRGLKELSISTVFLGTIGVIYMIDNLYPVGAFTPFQIFVPTTASLAASVLNLIGYQTTLLFHESLKVPILTVYDSSGQALRSYGIAWPCAGVQSLIIYSFVILVFFRKTTISTFHRIVYFAVGAVITYIVNVFRIVSIYLVYINNLENGPIVAEQAARTFHDYYGGLYSMMWILVYPLIIICVRMLWDRIRIHQSQRRLSNQSSVDVS